MHVADLKQVLRIAGIPLLREYDNLDVTEHRCLQLVVIGRDRLLHVVIVLRDDRDQDVQADYYEKIGREYVQELYRGVDLRELLEILSEN